MAQSIRTQWIPYFYYLSLSVSLFNLSVLLYSCLVSFFMLNQYNLLSLLCTISLFSTLRLFFLFYTLLFISLPLFCTHSFFFILQYRITLSWPLIFLSHATISVNQILIIWNLIAPLIFRANSALSLRHTHTVFSFFGILTLTIFEEKNSYLIFYFVQFWILIFPYFCDRTGRLNDVALFFVDSISGSKILSFWIGTTFVAITVYMNQIMIMWFLSFAKLKI